MLKTIKNIIIIVVGLALVLLLLSLKIPQKVVVDQVQNTTPVENSTYAIEGNKDDLISFSIVPGVHVHGILSYRGALKGGYFFEGNLPVNILDVNKKVLKQSNAIAKTDWMTVESVDFEGNIDFTGLTPGPTYFEIHNDNPSGLSENDKNILVPIVID